MSEKHSLNNKQRWANMTQEERSQKMSDLVKKRHEKMGKKAKRKLSLKMLKAKKAKAKLSTRHIA